MGKSISICILLLLMVNVGFLGGNVGVTSATLYNQEISTGNTFQAWLSVLWKQTSQAEFEAGVLSQVDTTSSSGDVMLATEVTPGNIATEDFEGGWSGGSGWLAGWWHEGSSDITSSGEPHGGSNHLQLRDSDGYVDRAVDLSGNANVRLQFWAKADSFSTGETIDLLVYDGTGWDTLKTWVDGDDDNVYRFYDFDLSGYNMSNPFWVAFDAEMTDDYDYFYVDDLAFVQPTIYYGSGTMASQVLDTTIVGSVWDLLFWDETLEGNTDITFEVRASDTVFLKDDGAPSWDSVGGISPVTSGLAAGRYKQWRATLSTSNTTNTPTLHEVRAYYR